MLYAWTDGKQIKIATEKLYKINKQGIYLKAEYLSNQLSLILFLSIHYPPFGLVLWRLIFSRQIAIVAI